MELIFRGPDGNRLVNEIDEVVRLIRKASNDFWENSSSGDAELTRKDGDEQHRLSLYFLPGGGGSFQLVWRGEMDVGLLTPLPTRPPAKPEWVDIFVGGNPKRISSGQTLNRS